MFSEFRNQIISLILAGLSFGLLFAGCSQPAQDPGLLPTDPFSARAEGEDGIVVEWSGNSRGHLPGGESEFDLQLVNMGEQPWSGKYCFQLVDINGVVETYKQANFSLLPGEGFSTKIRTNFSEELAEAPYGLMLIIPGRLANTVTIYVGNSHGQTAGPWPTQVECP